jgi:hypothetical protein
LTEDPALARECRVLTRYLVGTEPTDYVIRTYAAANDALALAPSGRFDRLLLRLARGPAISRWPVAAFARVHAPDSALQARLVTLLAILETAPPSSHVLDLPPFRSRVLLALSLGLRGGAGVLSLVVGTLALLPVRWFLVGRSARL